MTTTVKGLFKGLRYISHIFDEKKPEMQIGFPTDVKHVAHIGGDGPSANSPSWMSQFKLTSDVSSMSSPARLPVQDKKHTGSQDSALLNTTEVQRSRRQPSKGEGSPISSPTQRGSNGRQSRRHRSKGSLDDSADQDQPGSSRSSRRHRNSNHGTESTLQDAHGVPKHSRRRKSKGSSKSNGQNSLTDIPFSDLGSGSEVQA